MRGNRLRQLLPVVAGFLVVLSGVGVTTVQAASNSTFNQTINAGTLTADILDAGGSPVASPAVAMSAKTASFTCQSGGSASTGTFGSNAERVSVSNPGIAASGWTLTIAATSGETAVWTSGGNTFDYNDAGGSGCTDGADADTKGGQLTIDPSVGTLATDCASCTTANISKGSSAAFLQGTTPSVTILNAAAGSDDLWRGYLTGATLSQPIPAETPAGTYTMNMTLTVTAQ
jgi:hypothetical protein